MRINRYLDIYAGETLEEMAEGRFAYLAEGNERGAFGVYLPSSEAEALLSVVCVAWPPTNQSPPFYMPTSNYEVAWSLRTFDKPANDPFDAEVHMIYPGFRENSTIPVNTFVRLFPVGSVITLTSGNFLFSASYAPGVSVSIAYSGATAGKPQYDASGTIATVVYYDSDNQELTVRIK